MAIGDAGSEASGWRKGNGEDGESAAPNNIEQRCDRATELKNQGQYDEAAAEFQAILSVTPGHARSHLGLGLVLCFVGKFDESLEELKLAVACDPGWIDGHLNLAKTYAMLGMYDEAKTEFNHVLERHPGHPEATKQLKYFEGGA